MITPDEFLAEVVKRQSDALASAEEVDEYVDSQPLLLGRISELLGSKRPLEIEDVQGFDNITIFFLIIGLSLVKSGASPELANAALDGIVKAAYYQALRDVAEERVVI